MQICAVKAPGFGENRKSSLQDLAVLTGGSVSFSFDVIALAFRFNVFFLLTDTGIMFEFCCPGNYRGTWFESGQS